MNPDFDLQEELKKLPHKPGVYIMHDKKDAILYVGKAINLNRRVHQYFVRKLGRGAKIERMVSMCGASLPAKFVKVMQKYENNPEALRDAGIAYAINQIVDLIANGVDGVHLYTMNNAYVARRITEAVSSLIERK